MLATYRPHDRCWTAFTAVCWQPTCLVTSLGTLLGLYVGNPTGVMKAVGPLLRLYVGNPTGVMKAVGPLLRLYVGNLHAL